MDGLALFCSDATATRLDAPTVWRFSASGGLFVGLHVLRILEVILAMSWPSFCSSVLVPIAMIAHIYGNLFRSGADILSHF